MATAPLYGKVEELDSSQEDWTQYIERLGHYFDANETEIKRAILLSVIGPSTYRLVKSLVAPAKPGDKSYDEVVNRLSARLNDVVVN